MGSKTQETTQTSSIAEASPEQQQMQQLMAQFAERSLGQLGDLSGLASGQLGQLTPEIEQAIIQAQEAARLGVQQNYEQELRNQQVGASARGIDGGTTEAVGSAILGQGRTNQLAQLDSQAAQQRLQLPLQFGQLQLGANQLLGQQFQGSAGANLQALLQQQLGQGTQSGTQTQSGFSIGDITPLAGAFSFGG